MIVYRVAHHGQNLGPWHHNTFWKYVPRRLEDMYDLVWSSGPGWRDDFFGDLWDQRDKLSGVPNMKNIPQWFNPLIHRALHRTGFRVLVYDVPSRDVEMGNSGLQVRFNPERATLLRRLPLKVACRYEEF